LGVLRHWLGAELCFYKEAINKLRLKPKRHDRRHILTVNGTKEQSMPVFAATIESADGSVSKSIELTGSKMSDFTTVKPRLHEQMHLIK
jgi:hypothetical protein